MHLAHILRQGNSRINVFMRFQERGVIILWESGVGRGKFTSNPPLLELVEFTQCVLVEVMPYFNAAYLCLRVPPLRQRLIPNPMWYEQYSYVSIIIQGRWLSNRMYQSESLTQINPIASKF